MAFEHYMLVNNSCLYEGKGVAKPLLARIAHLIIAEPEEGPDGKPKGKRDPDAGYCTATQDYLAAQIGCSVSEVQSWIDVFVDHGWLTKETYRNRLGHIRNKYKLSRLADLAEMEMKQDEQGRFIRTKNPKMARKHERSEKGFFVPSPQSEVREALPQSAVRPDRNLKSRLTADGSVPDRNLRLKLVVVCSEAGDEAGQDQSSQDNASQTPSVRPLRGDQENLDPVRLSTYLEGVEVVQPGDPVNPQDTPTVPQTPSRTAMKEMPKVSFSNPVYTHNWKQNINLCSVCGMSRDEVKYEKKTCEEVQAEVTARAARDEERVAKAKAAAAWESED